MTETDSKQLASELCRRWKGKLTRDDLAYWARELDGNPIAEITDALTKFRNTSRFVPKPKEILALLPRRVDGANAEKSLSEKEGSFADVLRRQNRQYKGRCDAEVYLRHHRALWVTYGGEKSKNPEPIRRQLTSGCVNNLMTIPMDRREAERFAEFIYDSPEMFRLVLNDLRAAPTPEAREALEHVFD